MITISITDDNRIIVERNGVTQRVEVYPPDNELVTVHWVCDTYCRGILGYRAILDRLKAAGVEHFDSIGRHKAIPFSTAVRVFGSK